MQDAAAAFTAIGTVAVAILAIWGDWVRTKLAGPQLVLSLLNTRGDLNPTNYGQKQIYYHLKVENQRTWSPAKQVRVLVTGIKKRRPDGSYYAEQMIAPLQLTWAYPQFHELFPTIGTAETCDFGFLSQGDDQFKLSPYISPNNFAGHIKKGDSMQVQVVATAHNGVSEPISIEVSWDGVWSADLEEMQRHLVIKQLV